MGLSTLAEVGNKHDEVVETICRREDVKVGLESDAEATALSALSVPPTDGQGSAADPSTPPLMTPAASPPTISHEAGEEQARGSSADPWLGNDHLVPQSPGSDSGIQTSPHTMEIYQAQLARDRANMRTARSWLRLHSSKR